MKNKATDNILNGIGNVRDTSGETVPFLRDPDRLIAQYRNFRLRLMKDYNPYFSSPQDKEELRQYIDETFIKLVKEYSIHGNIDFQGYIKMKLEARVKHSFRDKKLKDKYREFTVKDDGFIEASLDKAEQSYIDTDVDVIEELLSGVTLTDLELDIFKLLLEGYKKRDIVSALKSSYTLDQINQSYKDMREFVYHRLQSLIAENK